MSAAGVAEGDVAAACEGAAVDVAGAACAGGWGCGCATGGAGFCCCCIVAEGADGSSGEFCAIANGDRHRAAALTKAIKETGCFMGLGPL